MAHRCVRAGGGACSGGGWLYAAAGGGAREGEGIAPSRNNKLCAALCFLVFTFWSREALFLGTFQFFDTLFGRQIFWHRPSKFSNRTAHDYTCLEVNLVCILFSLNIFAPKFFF